MAGSAAMAWAVAAPPSEIFAGDTFPGDAFPGDVLPNAYPGNAFPGDRPAGRTLSGGRLKEDGCTGISSESGNLALLSAGDQAVSAATAGPPVMADEGISGASVRKDGTSWGWVSWLGDASLGDVWLGNA